MFPIILTIFHLVLSESLDNNATKNEDKQESSDINKLNILSKENNNKSVELKDSNVTKNEDKQNINDCDAAKSEKNTNDNKPGVNIDLDNAKNKFVKNDKNKNSNDNPNKDKEDKPNLKPVLDNSKPDIIDINLQNEIAEKIGLNNIKNTDELKTKRWGVVIENKDKNNHIKSIKKIEIAVELLTTQTRSIVKDGDKKEIETKTLLKPIIAPKKQPHAKLAVDTEANKKLLRDLAEMLHLNKSVKQSDIKKPETTDVKLVEITDKENKKDEQIEQEKYYRDFESVNGGLHILYTISNNLKLLKKAFNLKREVDKIKGILIYNNDGEYKDYWDKLTFDKKDDKYVDETGFFEGIPVENFKDITEKGYLSPLGFFIDKETSVEELKKQFETIKKIVKEIAKKKKKNIPDLFKDNNKIPVMDRVIFANAYKNPLPQKKDADEYIKICVCDDSFCLNPCEQIRWIKKSALE